MRFIKELNLLTKQLISRIQIHELLFVALSFTVGLQMVRSLMTGLVYFLRESKETTTLTVGCVALLVFLSIFLTPFISRILGLKALTGTSALGLGIIRFLEQLNTTPAIDLGLAIGGTILFLLTIPIGFLVTTDTIKGGGGVWCLGVLSGIGIDTAVKGGFGTIDLSWHSGVGANSVAYAIVFIQLVLSGTLVSKLQSEERTGYSLFSSIPLVALGPFLVIQMLFFQNIGQQTVLIGWPQPAVLALMMFTNICGLGLAFAIYGRRISVVFIALLGILLTLFVAKLHTGIVAAAIMVFGHICMSILLAKISESVASTPKLKNCSYPSGAIGTGMLLFVLLIFSYYARFDIDIGVSSSGIILIAAGTVGLAALKSTNRSDIHPFTTQKFWSLIMVIFLMLSPFLYFLFWSDVRASMGTGFPVRVMTYNVHQGFGTAGKLNMETIAQVIEDEKPDVVALQEISRGWLINGSVDMLDWLSQRLSLPYISGPTADSLWGNAVLSRYPINSAKTYLMPNNEDMLIKRGFIWMEIDIGKGQIINFINTHLHAGEGDGYLRVPQVAFIIDEWHGANATVLLGDLNAQPHAAEIKQLELAGFQDSFAETNGTLLGFTSESDNPYQRIDYIWVTEDLSTIDYSITESLASDHFPIAVTVYPKVNG